MTEEPQTDSPVLAALLEAYAEALIRCRSCGGTAYEVAMSADGIERVYCLDPSCGAPLCPTVKAPELKGG